MFSRFRSSLVLALALALVLAIPVFAGGWAVITLDELPAGAIAGEPLTIGFTVLQHGRTPMTGLDPTITATLLKDEQFVVVAESEGKPGHYMATLTFPKEGNWEWSVQAFTMDQPMPVLYVAAVKCRGAYSCCFYQPNCSVAKTETAPAETASISPLLIVRVLALAIGSVGLVAAFRRQSRLAVALTVLCLLVGLASFITGSSTPVNVEAQSKSSSELLGDTSISQVELGRQLFIAKGCITCHVNSKVTRASEYWVIEMGAPNLTNFSASPEALRLRLKNPSSVKSDTKMPNLDLSDDEIEALIAFINSK